MDLSFNSEGAPDSLVVSLMICFKRYEPLKLQHMKLYNLDHYEGNVLHIICCAVRDGY